MHRCLVVLLSLACAHSARELAPPPPGFDDHTAAGFSTVDGFRARCDLGKTPVQCKFVMTRFWDAGGQTAYLDPRFYDLHDEWYWFRLLNGQPVDGVDTEPVHDTRFDSVARIKDTYRGRADLPLDLSWRAERLASTIFYNMALGRCIGLTGWGKCQRLMGVGSILTLPADPRRRVPEALWLFELDFADEPTDEELARYVERLEPTLPPEARGRLRWLARTSEHQERLAHALAARPGPLAARVATYADLVVPGAVAAYTPGITAGRLKRVPKGSLAKVALSPTDIVLLEDVPDDLPPVAGIVTAVPQTPQAHLNLLATARGTPNVYSSDAFDDPLLASWAKDETPAILEVHGDTMRWKALTADEWTAWLGFTGRAAMHITPIDVATAPYVVDLSLGGLAAMRQSLPLVGGKSAGMMALLGAPELPTPYRPLGVTIRGYVEHLAPLRPSIEALLAEPAFADDRRVRFLCLEGREAMVEASRGDKDAATWLASFVPEGQVADVVARGGVRQMIEHAAMAPAFRETLRAALTRQFGALAPEQGLRFRSSSTAEDVDGFNGAGVYDSNTGFLAPEGLTDPKAKRKTVERAVLKTWASYWTFGAFEERRLAAIPHLDGNMGLLVEPSFQDEKETANGVALVGVGRGFVELTVNVQRGAVSVTNPVAGKPVLAEIDRVRRADGEAPVITRVQSAGGGVVLSDAELLAMLDSVSRLGAAWLADANRSLSPAERSRSVTLDLEVRRVAPGWPVMRAGEPAPPRLVYKQVRPLSRPPRVTSADLGGAPVPRDVLAATTSVLRRTCTAGPLHYTALELLTDPAATLVRPMVAWVRVDMDEPIDALGLTAGERKPVPHTDVTVVHAEKGAWGVTVTLPPARATEWGFDTVTLSDGGAWSVSKGAATASGAGTSCSALPTVVTPAAWLEAKMAR